MNQPQEKLLASKLMHDYCQERFRAQMSLAGKIAAFMGVNDILETIRSELRTAIPHAMEACVLLLDPDAKQYTRPMQCALYDRPVNCLMCKRSRPAVKKAMKEKKAVIFRASSPVLRHDSSSVEIGPEAAMPVLLGEEVIAVISLVSAPDGDFSRRDFLFLKDFSETLANVIVTARRHWETTKEKIRISKMLDHLSHFVPQSVRVMVEKNPELLSQEKQLKDVSILFLDLEGYTALSQSYPEVEVNRLVERLFSSFVDPIQRSKGDINETAGDGLMIIFKEDDARTNAINSVKAAFEIHERATELNAAIDTGIKFLHVKIGINSGQALLGMTRLKGSLDTRMTFTASGPVTNMAARLASLAKGGEILIGEETTRLITGLWPIYEIGEAKLKGFDGPVKVFSLTKPPS
jgi:class 3 adenylate cyclase